MEALFLIAILWIVFLIIRSLFRSEDSSSQDVQSKVPLDFQVSLRDIRQEVDAHSFVVKEVWAIGLLPVTRSTDLGMCISVLDGKMSVRCHIKNFRELGSPAYQVRTGMGVVGPNQGLVEWTRVAAIIPEILHPPYGGLRQLKIEIRLIDLSNLPPIMLGLLETPKHSGLIWSKTLVFAHKFTEKGYLEVIEDRKMAVTLSLKMAMAIAMSDGSLHEKEELAIQKSTERLLKPYSGEEQKTMQKLCEQALKESYTESRQGTLKLESLTDRLKGIGNQQLKYEALKICTDVMKADNVADPNELALLHRIGDLLDLDMKQIKEIIDGGLAGPIDILGGDNDAPEKILGIDPNWGVERIRKHLLDEFRKWNGRLNTLPDGRERENAQYMLDLIAEVRDRVRKKYG